MPNTRQGSRSSWRTTRRRRPIRRKTPSARWLAARRNAGTRPSSPSRLPVGYYERAIEAAPADPRAYLGLGQLYQRVGNLDLAKQGNLDLAIQTWRRGLKAIATEDDCPLLNLDVAEVLLKEGRPMEAEAILKTIMKNVDGYLAKQDPRRSPILRSMFQNQIDRENAQLFFLKGQYEKAIPLLAEVAVSKQGDNGDLTPQKIYEAWMMLGESHKALKHWGPALAAFEQARLQSPKEFAPRVDAAEVEKAMGRNDAAIDGYQQALEIVNHMQPPPEGSRQAIYEALIPLLEGQKRSAEAERYQTLRREQMAESARLTLLGRRTSRPGRKTGRCALAARQARRREPSRGSGGLSRSRPGPAGQQGRCQGGRGLS